jgi:L-lactate dehydrogenase complex protein LldG
MSDREHVLQRVRAALGRSEGAAVAPPPALPMLGAVDDDAAARIARFGERLGAVAGECEWIRDAGALPASVVAALHAHGARTVAVSDAPAVQHLLPQLTAAGFRCMLPSAARADLLAADAGLTAAQWGIAETGTIVLDAASERSRLPSLLPPLHVALLPASRVLATLGELLKTLPRPLPYATTFVTGPSRTADIELQLVVGVHGPRALHVLLT